MSRRHPKVRLSPVWLPYIRQRLARCLSAQLAGPGVGDERWRRMLAASWSDADLWRRVPVWWVSRDMTTLAWDTALGSMPDNSGPEPAGFVTFDGGLPIEVPDSAGVMRSVDALIWQIMRNGDQVVTVQSLYTRDPAAPHYPGGGDLPLAPLVSAGMDPEINDQITRTIVAMCVLSAYPTVCQQQAPTAHDRSQAPPAYRDPMEHPVKMLILREHPAPPATDGHGEAREYACRWIVRGHWRNQAYGPGHSLRRRQWIPPYVAGPADKPLLRKTTVRVWRR